MKSVLKRTISALLAVVLIAETPAMAAGNRPTNAQTSRSEDVRAHDQAIEKAKIYILTDEGVKAGRTEIKEIKELLDLLQAEADLTDAEVQALRNDKAFVDVNSATLHFTDMLENAKNGFFVAAGSHRDHAVIQFLLLTRFINRASRQVSKPIGPALVLSIMRAAFASVGPVTRVERERVLYSLTDFLQTLATADSNKALKKLYRKVGNVELTSGVAGVTFSLLLTIEGVKGLSYLPFSMRTYGLVGLLAGLIGMSYGLTLAISSLRLKRKLGKFKTERLDVAMASYLKTEFNPEIVRRIQSRSQGVESSDDTAVETAAKKAQEEIKKQLRLLSGSELRASILQPIALRSNMQALFDAASDDPEATERIDAMITQDPELAAMAKRGRSFREAYRQSLTQTFGTVGAEFVTDPELEILKELRMARNNVIETKFQELTFKQAEMRAWEETKVRFGLPADLELSTLEEKRYDNPTYFPAYEFFRRAYFQAQQKETPRVGAVEFDLKKFKTKIREEVYQRRAENFIEALKMYQKLHPRAKEIKVRVGNGVETVRIADLLASRIEFQMGAGYQTPIRETERRLNDLWITKFSLFSKVNDKDVDVASEFYRLKAVHPAQMQHEIIFHSNDGKTNRLQIMEASFSRLLFELGPKYAPLENFEDNDQRYLGEAARRDANLANASTFMNEERDNDPMALERRLSNKVSSRARLSKNSKTLTEELRDNPHVNHTPSLFNDLRWFGYAIHPDYWRVRDAEFDAARAEVVKAVGTKEEDQQKAEFEKIKKKWETIGKTRLSYAERVKLLAKRAAYVAAFFGLLGAAMSGAGQAEKSSGFPTWGESESVKERYKNYSSELDELQMDSIDKATNHPAPPEGSDVDSKNYFLIDGFPSKRAPRYLNLADPSNLPGNVLMEEALTYHDVSSRIEFDRSITKLREINGRDFVIRSRVPMVAKDYFLPLPSPDGYRVAEIDIDPRKAGTLPILNRNYRVYFDNRTGLSYVRFTEQKSGTYDVWVKYKPIEKPESASDVSWHNLDKTVIAKTNQSLIDLGATQLAGAITKAISREPKPTLQNVAEAFTFSGTYTYDREKYSFRPLSSNPFEPFRKFLREDEFYYQCTGSNKLMGKFLQTYYREANPDIEVQNLIGFTFEGDSASARVSPIGHMHTVAFKRKEAYQYVELDGTPAHMDPKYAHVPRNVVYQTSEETQPADQEKQRQRQDKPKDKPQGPTFIEPDSRSHPVPNPYALRPAPLRVVHTKRPVVAKPTPQPKTEEPEEKPEPEKPNGAVVPQPDAPMDEAAQARVVFEKLIGQIKSRIGVLKDLDNSLGQPSQRRPGMNDLALILSVRKTLDHDMEPNGFLRQVLTLHYSLPLNRELGPSEEEFLRAKMTEALAAAKGQSSVALKATVQTLKDAFTEAVKRERAKLDRRGGKKPDTSKTAYLLDQAFVQLMNQYYDFLMNTNLEKFTRKAAPSTPALTCQNIFKK